MFIDSRLAFASCCVTTSRHDDADDRHERHHAAFRLRRRDQPRIAPKTIRPREHEQRRAVGLRGEDLHAAQPEGQVALRGPAERGAARSARAAARPASVSMCAASESSASESARMPATTSPTMNATISASPIAEPPRVGVGPDDAHASGPRASGRRGRARSCIRAYRRRGGPPGHAASGRVPGRREHRSRQAARSVRDGRGTPARVGPQPTALEADANSDRRLAPDVLCNKFALDLSPSAQRCVEHIGWCVEAERSLVVAC